MNRIGLSYSNYILTDIQTIIQFAGISAFQSVQILQDYL